MILAIIIKLVNITAYYLPCNEYHLEHSCVKAMSNFSKILKVVGAPAGEIWDGLYILVNPCVLPQSLLCWQQCRAMGQNETRAPVLSPFPFRVMIQNSTTHLQFIETSQCAKTCNILVILSAGYSGSWLQDVREANIPSELFRPAPPSTTGV